jgi:hypothetical protein
MRTQFEVEEAIREFGECVADVRFSEYARERHTHLLHALRWFLGDEERPIATCMTCNGTVSDGDV